MTHPTDFFSHPLPESGVGVHSQESGDAGLSSNMEHKFGDCYSEPALGADKGSHVTPIFTGGACDYPKRVQKMWSRPVFISESDHTGADEEGFIKPRTEAAVQRNFPLATEKVVLEEEEAAKVTSAATSITDKQPEGDILNAKMDNQAKPRRRPRGKGRKKRGRHTFWKDPKVYLFVMAAMLRPVSAGALSATDQKLKCFSCNDKAKCPNLTTIYDTNDVPKYSGGAPFPQCSEISPPSPEKCTVCYNQCNNSITINCSGDVGKLEVETDKDQIDDISPVDCGVDPCRSHAAVVLSAAPWLVVVAALVFRGFLV